MFIDDIREVYNKHGLCIRPEEGTLLVVVNLENLNDSIAELQAAIDYHEGLNA